MRVIHCPSCKEPLPWHARFCARCGHTLILEGATSRDNDETIRVGKPAYFVKAEENRALHAVANGKMSAMSNDFAPIAAKSPPDNDLVAKQRIEEWLSEEEYGDELDRRVTWQKIVAHKAPTILLPSSLSAAAARDAAPHPTSPPSPRPSFEALPPSPVLPLFRLVPPPERDGRRFLRAPHLYAWVAALVIIALLIGGGFGIFASFGHNTAPQLVAHKMSLQVSPASIMPGGTITLRGSSFSRDGQVGLRRDGAIPLLDGAGRSLIRADANGAFQDTVIIDNSWSAGAHTISAEDAHLHKIASFTIQVNGVVLSLRPPRLTFSSTSVDLGSGDQASNAAQTISLTNIGGGQISWQATATQPWLLISPPGGTVAGGQQLSVTLAGDRSDLEVGSYSAAVIFTWDTEQFKLPVQMQVTPLEVDHEAVLQATPGVLSFSAIDGGLNPSDQVVTVSNPGVQPLNWSEASVTSDGSNWLFASPSSGTVAQGSSQAVVVSINSSIMLPGVYYGSISFSSQGSNPAMNSPQTIYISVTIAPQCAIQVQPGALTFTAVYLQAAPPAKAISVGMNQSCSAPLTWSAAATTSSGGSWLTISAASGSAPSAPTVGIAVAGLSPGTYNGQLLFSSTAGTQTIPVTLIMGKPTTPILSSSVALLSVNGITGQPVPSPSAVVLTNSGGGTLDWQAAATTAVGGAWLSTAPAFGSLTSQQTTNIAVKAVILPGMIPGVYTGTITLTGSNGAGNPAAGSPQSIAVTFTVQAPCAIATSIPALNFQGVIGQPAPATQAVTISASGACANTLDWTATAATKPAGGTWLTTTPSSGTVTLAATSGTSVGAALAGLTAGTYNGSVTIAAFDSVTNQPVGKPQVITITLNMQPPCTLQAPSVNKETFSAEAGSNPAAQTFTVGIIGACVGSVTLTPTATTTKGGAWLSISPTSATVASGMTATFTVSISAAALAAGKYKGALSLAAVNGGIAITGSPQSIAVTLALHAPPALAVTPATLTFTQATGSSTQSITIRNSGGEPLNWTVTLDSNAPAYVTISSATSGKLASGATTKVMITVDTTGLPGGTPVSTSVTINATDPLTGAVTSGSPATVAISIAPPPPTMQLSASTLTFTTTATVSPAPQTVTLTNGGGNGLTWTVGTPSQTWLTVTPTSGSDNAGASSTLTFAVDVTGLPSGSYTATVTITPSTGAAQVVTVNLTVN